MQHNAKKDRRALDEAGNENGEKLSNKWDLYKVRRKISNEKVNLQDIALT